MPTVLRVSGFRFFFYSLEGSEPPHIHVEHGDNIAKFWLVPVAVAESRGFRLHELNRVREDRQLASSIFLGEGIMTGRDPHWQTVPSPGRAT